MTDIMHESDFPHETARTPEDIFNESNRSDASDITPIDYAAEGLRSSGFAAPRTPNQIANALLHTDVVQGKPDAGASQWLLPAAQRGYLVGIPSLSLTFGSPAMIDPVAVVAWVRRIADQRVDAAQGVCAVTVGSWVNPDTGSVHFDASSWHDNMSSAGRTSVKRGEHSYFDIENQRCVRTAGHGFNG